MKKYLLNTAERKTLAARIGELAGMKMKYSGMPRCAYECEGFSIERNGDLLVGDDADSAILQTLLDEGLIRPEEADDTETAEAETGEPGTEMADATDPDDGDSEAAETERAAGQEDGGAEETDSLTISLPLTGHTADSLRRLLNLIYSRGPLISKATGGAFGVTKDLLDALDAMDGMNTVEAFKDKVGSMDGLTGIAFGSDWISFTGFPMTEEPDRLTACQQLACAMNRQALEQKRIQAKEIATESEKYTFRNWLVRIGMGTPEFKTARMLLLENLSGHTAFRNKAEEEKWKASQKAKREAAKQEKAADETEDPAEEVEKAPETESSEG